MSAIFPRTDPIDWVQQQISVGVNPKELLVALVGPDCPLVGQCRSYGCTVVIPGPPHTAR